MKSDNFELPRQSDMTTTETSNHLSNGTISGNGVGKLKTETKEDSTLENSLPSHSVLRVWCSITLCSVCYVVGILSLGLISVQYFSHRIAQDEYNFEYNDSNSECSNASDNMEDQMDHVQKKASQVILNSGLAVGIPACITCLLVGSYSDYIGRKPILLASMIGGFLRVALLTLIVKFEWDIRLYYIGAAVDGIFGSYFTLIMAATAVIADITPNAKNRALNFAVIEGLMLPTAAAAQIGIGYLIRDKSFFLPLAIICGLLLVAMATNILLLPETMQWKREFVWDPRIHLRKVVGFYFFDGGPRKRRLYLVGMCAFVIIAITNIGRQGVETLFELSYPLCWDPVNIGYYLAIRFVGTAVLTVVFLKLMKNRLSLEVTGVICAMSGTAGFVIFGLSKTSAELYLAALVGALYFGCIPIPRGLLSQMAPRTEQGALFSSLSLVDTVSSLISSTLFTVIYNATIDSFKGSVFMFIAVLTFLNAVFLLIFRYMRAGWALFEYSDMIEASTEISNTPSPRDSVVDESSNLLDNKQ